MLYIFHVETGRMMTFDINFAIESVVSLKKSIEKLCNIPANKQVLLVSGGEVLRPDARVCSYSAGTDTNPIFMFSKTIIESEDPPKSFDYKPDIELNEEVEQCLKMTPSYNTVLACGQLAQRFWDISREHLHSCNKLVHEQHLQQQGWAAVVANMEDVTSDFNERAEDFENKFRDQVNKRQEYTEFLSRFNEDLEILSNIPILPALRLNAASNPFKALDGLHGDSESFEDDNSVIKEEGENEDCDISETQKASNDGSSSSRGVGGSTTSEGDEGVELSKDGKKLKRHNIVRMKSKQSNKEALTLLHWITVKENQESLKHIAEYCKTAMDMFDSNVTAVLRQDVKDTLDSARKENMKRIRGLEERLSGLEQLLYEAQKLEQDQKDLAHAFQNKQTAANLSEKDALLLVCESHRKQLQNMLRNHHRLIDMKRRCAKAKEELAVNLYHRLQWIVYVENRMFEIDSKLMFYHRSLARLRKHLAVISQLHRAPRLFCTAVHEIVRRRTFSQAFLTWASDLAGHLLTIHNEEVMRRKTFNSLFCGHFLGGLFPGTDDMPPPFATQVPKPFDGDLPRLTQVDIDTLNCRLPNLKPEIPQYDITQAVNFFQSRSGNQESKQYEDKATNVTKEIAIDRGFESETDTEEFEKVGQSPIDRGGGAAQLPAAPMRTDATTLTEENLGTISSKQNESECWKELLSSIVAKCNESINTLKSELENVKKDVTGHRNEVKDDCQELVASLERYTSENALRERETLQRLTVDHELEMNDIKQVISKKGEEISTLKEDLICQREQFTKMLEQKDQQIMDLEEKIRKLEGMKVEHAKVMEEAEVAKQKAIKELQEKMAHEYKAEVESLRSRFRLVAITSMDRSPSESSLEKIERSDMIEITNHKAIVLQTKADMEQEKEEAIKTISEKKDEEWTNKLTLEIEEYKKKCEAERRVIIKDAVKRIIDEKDRQLDQSRDRESILYRECLKYKETIQQLTDPETSNFSSCKQFHLDAATNTDFKICKKMPKSHTPLGLPTHSISLSSCEIGNVVFVLWDGMHCNYTILQESPILYLLHPDCLSSLDLKLNVKDESDRRLYTIGRVENKEFCHAVRSGNKYQVGVSQRFYRVKVGPVKFFENISKYYCCDNSHTSKDHDSSQSKTVMRMYMSEMGQLSDGSSKSRSDCSMSRSVHHVQSSSTKEKSTEVSRSSHEKTKNVMGESTKTLQMKQDDGTETLGSINEEKAEDQISSQLLPIAASDINPDAIVNVTVQSSDQCVPYAENELISEIAEEAAP